MDTERDRVDAKVEKSAAGEFWVPKPVLRVVAGRDGEIGLDTGDLAEAPTADKLGDLPDHGVEPGPHRLHHEQPPLSREAGEFLRLTSCRGERLLHQHRQARQQAQPGRRDVPRMGSGDVNDIEPTIGGEVFIRFVRPLDAELPGKAVRTGCSSRANGSNDMAVETEQVFGEVMGDTAGAKNSPPYGLVRGSR